MCGRVYMNAQLFDAQIPALPHSFDPLIGKRDVV